VSPIYVCPTRRRWGRGIWCHLFSEDIEALHQFAARIGLQRSWFQCPPAAKWPHYDIPLFRRTKAIEAGAIVATRKQFVEIARRIQALTAMTAETEALGLYSE